jgi:hypothetical protein
VEQSVQILNHQELMELFNLYMLFHSRGTSLVNVICIEDEAVTTINLALSCVSHFLPNEMKSLHGPQTVCKHFLKGILSEDALTAFHLMSTLDFKSLSPTNIEHTHWDHRYRHFYTWKKFHLRLHSAFHL